MQRYVPKDIEPKWQQAWQEQGLAKAADFDNHKKKYVMLTEFPYPSGEGLHLGHIREYTYGDMLARHKRMQGYNVLYPMGFDEFGLPTENYAIKNKVTPQSATAKNVATFEQQMKSLGYSFDWERKVNTSDPMYYKWTQWLFLQFFAAGLAYQDEIAINWCPFCKTGLSNEEVVNGRHERCDTLVEKKTLKQWLLKITDYADRLIDGLKDVDYPSRIADQQINWIGRSTGAEVTFKIENSDDVIDVFTTAHDTIYGTTFMVLAPEHELVPKITTEEHRSNVNSYIKMAQSKTEIERQDEGREKTGVFTGAHAINPMNGERIQIWIADYVLAGYGTGAIMAVPGEDARDYEFAQKYKLPIVFTTEQQEFVNYQTELKQNRQKYKLANSGEFDGLDFEVGRQKILDKLVKLGVGYEKVQYKLHDWIFSRQHYWGEPIPIIHCPNCVADEIKKSAVAGIDFADHDNFAQLLTGSKTAVTRAKDDDKTPAYSNIEAGQVIKLTDTQDGSSLYARVKATRYFKTVSDLYADKGIINKSFGKEFDSEQALVDQYEKNRPGYTEVMAKNGISAWEVEVIKAAVAVPDDQLPVVLPEVDHYEPTDTGASPLAAITDWVNVKCPKCDKPAKRETDTMPNWAGSSWYYLRYYDAHNDQAFADPKKLEYWGAVDMYLGGMEHTTLHLLYSRFWHQFLYDQKLVPTPEPYAARRGQGIILAADNTKMSKTKGNIINPTDIISSGYGADALRLAISFLAPYDQTTPWSPESVAGTHRFLQRVWTLVQEFNDSKDHGATKSPDLQRAVHKAIKKVSADLEDFNFNTAIAALMECANDLYRLKAEDNYTSTEWSWALETLQQLLAPLAPHIAEELWEQLGQKGSVHVSKWPVHDDSLLIEDTATVVIQVNGKLRGTIEVASDAPEETVVATAKAHDKVATYLDGQTIRKTIYVPGKLVNFVV